VEQIKNAKGEKNSETQGKVVGSSFLSAKGAYSLIQRKITQKGKSRFEMGSE
jgi:hypothetical protein